MSHRLPALVLFGGLAVALPAGHAQDAKSSPKAQTAPGPGARKILPTRHADPAALAGLLAAHFEGRAVISPAGRGLLVSAPPAVVDEVAQLVGELDRPTRQVVLGVTIAEVGGKVEVPELTGEQALTKLAELAKAGQVTFLQRLTLTAAEGKEATVTAGGDRPIVSGSRSVGGPKGTVLQQVEYRPQGTTVKAKSRVGPDRTVTTDLTLDDGRAKAPEADDTGAAAGHTSFEKLTVATTLSIPAGRALVVQSNRRVGAGGRAVTLVVVTAEVLEPSPAGGP
jgi:type II secretory pathway component GspD/PulD (secretin)